MGLGIWELILILLIVVIVFGAGRLPELGSALGKGIRNFKKATNETPPIDVTPGNPKLEQGENKKPVEQDNKETVEQPVKKT
ncbi:MAG: twin-arginine translocase TatA/TatE family subunit [Deltaproteobacteria bacterium]|nr:twin-arginine translocase TatA/TatE family subunit [Deltaproteobacteria bacterium]